MLGLAVDSERQLRGIIDRALNDDDDTNVDESDDDNDDGMRVDDEGLAKEEADASNSDSALGLTSVIVDSEAAETSDESELAGETSDGAVDDDGDSGDDDDIESSQLAADTAVEVEAPVCANGLFDASANVRLAKK